MYVNIYIYIISVDVLIINGTDLDCNIPSFIRLPESEMRTVVSRLKSLWLSRRRQRARGQKYNTIILQSSVCIIVGYMNTSETQ